MALETETQFRSMRIFSLLVLCYFTQLQAQNTFSVVHHNLNMLAGSGRSIFEVDDGYLLFSVQWAWDSTTGAVFVTKFDLDGNYVFEKQHKRTRNLDPGLIDPIALNMDGSYTAAITCFEGGEAPDSIFLYTFDQDGDTTRSVFLDAAPSQGMRDCLLTPDGSFLISGICTIAVDPLADCACIRKVSASGEELWRKTWPALRSISNALPTSDGGYLLGTTDSFYPDLASILKVDSLGNQQWIRNFGGNALNGVSSLLEMEDGSFLVPSAFASLDSSQNAEDQYSSLYHYSSSGSLLWRHDIQYGRLSTAAQIMHSADGGYWLTGGYYQIPRDPDLATTIWKLDAAADTLFSRKYWYYGGYGAVNAATYGINTTSDGGLIMTGLAKQGINGEQPLLGSCWILKLDQFGCLTPGCQSVGVQEYEMALQNALQLSPNPSSTLVHVELPLPEGYRLVGDVQALVLDAQGKEVLRNTIGNTGLGLNGSLDVSGLPSGMYFLHLRDAEKWLAGGKVIVE